MSGQKGASLRTRNPTAIEPGYTAAMAAAKTPAQGLKSRQANQPTAANAAVSSKALSPRPHATDGSFSPSKKTGATRIG